MTSQRFRDLSIRSKLGLLSVVATTTALVLACVTFAAYDRFTFREGLLRRLETQAQIIGLNSIAALVFHDTESAASTLAALRAEPHVIASSIFANDGQVFVRYVRDSSQSNELCTPDLAPGRIEAHRIEGDRLLLYRRILSPGGEPVGIVCIQSDLGEVNERLRRYAVIAVVVLLISLLVGFVVSTRLQAAVSAPILHLAEIARRVSAEKDYSLHAAGESRDEIGQLITSFNEMLGRIQERDTALTHEITERKGAEERVRAHALRIETLHEIDRSILAAVHVDALAEAALNRIRRLVPCQLAAAHLFDSDTGAVRVITSEPNVRVDDAAWSLDGCFSPATVREHPVLYVEDVAILTAASPIEARLNAAGMRSVVTAALMGQGEQLFGVLTVSAAEPRAFEQEHRDIIREGADQLAIAILQARMHEQLRGYAMELEDRVQERTTQLAAANKELEAFSYSVSHDLRAPLRGMRGMAEALLEDYAEVLDASGRDFAERIIASATKMNTLIQELLAYSRLSRVELPRERVSLAAVVQDATTQLASDLAARAVQLTVDPSLPEVVGHHGTLVQAVANLLGNAAKFVPTGVPPEVRIRGEAHSDRVRLWVEDNGIGIAPEHHQRIFQLFERLHGDSTYSGTGIGLGIVQRGVMRMGGTVGVESTPGEGSRFWIELPSTERLYEQPDGNDPLSGRRSERCAPHASSTSESKAHQ